MKCNICGKESEFGSAYVNITKGKHRGKLACKKCFEKSSKEKMKFTNTQQIRTFYYKELLEYIGLNSENFNITKVDSITIVHFEIWLLDTGKVTSEWFEECWGKYRKQYRKLLDKETDVTAKALSNGLLSFNEIVGMCAKHG